MEIIPAAEKVLALAPLYPAKHAANRHLFERDIGTALASTALVTITHQSTPSGWHGQKSYSPEIVLGRTVAACVHPFAAWRLLSTSWRLLMLAAYAATSYVTVLAALLL